jgi:flagellar protein FliO/FliZ
VVELTVRLIASLAVVVGLLLLTVRLGARRFRPRADAPLRIVHRQALSRSSSLAVVEVGSRVLVLGTTEHQINVLAELGQHELPGHLAQVPELDEYDDQVIDMEAVRRSGTLTADLTADQAFDQGFDEQLDHSVREALRQPVAPPRTTQPLTQPSTQTLTQTLTRPVAPPAATGPLAGSVLSAETWRQAFAVATGRSR